MSTSYPERAMSSPTSFPPATVAGINAFLANSTGASPPRASNAATSSSMAGIPSAATTSCTNVRTAYAKCGHICLVRCPLHPGTYFNKCPDPKASFSSTLDEGLCPRCAEHDRRETNLERIKQQLADLDFKKWRILTLKKDCGIIDPKFAMELDAIAAAAQRLEEEKKPAVWAAGEYRGDSCQELHAERIGWSTSKVYPRFGKPTYDFKSVEWATCEQDEELWTWPHGADITGTLDTSGLNDPTVGIEADMYHMRV